MIVGRDETVVNTRNIQEGLYVISPQLYRRSLTTPTCHFRQLGLKDGLPPAAS
jgi:hypothetical protein